MRAAARLRPRALGPGATLGVCAPAGPVDPAVLERAAARLEARGFKLARGPNLLARAGYLAGSDDERLADLLGLVRAPEVDAILLARGGYGASRLLRRLDPAELGRARKLVIGYSEATALALLLLGGAGLASLHGPMLERDDITEPALDRLVALASGAGPELPPLRGRALAGGRAEGPLVGGNLKLVAASLGTPWEIDTRGAILFLEEVGEQPYAVDRSLGQLRDAGKLRDVAGVAVGQLVECRSERYPEVAAAEVVEQVLTPEVEGPVVVDLSFGHVANNLALPIGTRAALDGGRGALALLEPAVEGAA